MSFGGGVSTSDTTPWWEVDKESPEAVAGAVFATVTDIERRQQSIHDGHRRHARAYAGYMPTGFVWGENQASRAPQEVSRSVIRSVCDTATALISRFRPKPSFVTDGADWAVQRMAMDLDKFMIGAYEIGNVYKTAARCFHDSTVFGTSAWKLVPTGAGKSFRVDCEHVLIDDLVVDEDECREHSEPVNTYHRVPMRADALVRQYAQGDAGKKISKESKARREAIAAAKGGRGSDWPGGRTVRPDSCIVVEAIHVCGTRGRRVVAVAGCTLVDEAWEFDWHPYVVLHWAPPLSGFYGDGIAYRQYGRQQRITYLYRWIQRCHDLFATPRAWVDPAGGPPTMQLSNEIGQVILSRRPPVFQTQQVVPPEVYRWLDGLERGTFDDEGISQATASNQLPSGIESAPAQREYSFKEGNRFAPVSQRWEHAVAVETPKKMIAMYRAAAGDGEGAAVPFHSRKLRQTIDWSAASLEEDAYMIRAEASSLESLSPSSRTQAAIELSQTGWITPSEGRSLLGHPDLERSDQIGSAPRRYAEWVLLQLMRGTAMAVNEFADLVELRKVVQGGYLDAVTRNAPEQLLANLERYLDELTAIEPPPPAPPAPPPAAAMADPAAMGMPLPLGG